MLRVIRDNGSVVAEATLAGGEDELTLRQHGLRVLVLGRFRATGEAGMPSMHRQYRLTLDYPNSEAGDITAEHLELPDGPSEAPPLTELLRVAPQEAAEEEEAAVRPATRE